LIGFGRLSADRESVALLACGISIYRLMRPVMVVAVASWAVTSWVMLDAVPRANQAFREIVYGVISARAENEIKPRIFFEDFPNRILYIGDALTGGGWRQVFLADTMKPEEPTVFTAASGQLVINREKRTVDLLLQNGSKHTANLRDPSKYEVARVLRTDSRPRSRHRVQRGGGHEGRERDDDSRAARARRRAREAALAVARAAHRPCIASSRFPPHVSSSASSAWRWDCSTGAVASLPPSYPASRLSLFTT
jgi:lipopolysaccharide export LptBFGC system permease protein LptF